MFIVQISITCLFIVLALIAMVGFIKGQEPFRVWVWPLNATLWALSSLVNLIS